MKALRFISALVLVRIADRLDTAALKLATKAVGEDRICHVGNGMVSVSETCERCAGKGYHHGFGEDGVDPDWCDTCGGSGSVTLDLTLDDVFDMVRSLWSKDDEEENAERLERARRIAA